MSNMWSYLISYQNNLLIIGKAALCLLFSIIFAWLLGKLWDVVAGRLAARSSIEIYKRLVKASHRYLVIFTFLFFVKFTLGYLGPAPGQAFFGALDKLFYTAMVIVLALLVDLAVHVAVDWYSREYYSRTQGSLEQFLPLIRQLARLVIYFIAFTFILEYFGKNITGLIATAGVASLAIALAAQETLSNMFAGLMIMLDRPFRPGDRIELDKGHVGDVIQIGTRTTRILTPENNVIVVPNKDLANSRIVNHVFPTPDIGVTMEVRVAYGSDINVVKAVLKEILAGNARVLKEPEPGVFFTAYGISSLNLSISFTIENYRDRLGVIDELNMSIKERFEKEGIEIPYPRSDVFLVGKEGESK
ncbi:mechanosensitive ion channel family protein [Pelotomaculum propionicicum]|uniref:mechanosensitive ion channel family protein n=1 Tax=Pelotomaculum propionicicum TaxID=258475 RepID=UPI003B7E47B8